LEESGSLPHIYVGAVDHHTAPCCECLAGRSKAHLLGAALAIVYGVLQTSDIAHQGWQVLFQG